jgi:type III secretion system low calcium response chaperone LcrH/SycD
MTVNDNPVRLELTEANVQEILQAMSDGAVPADAAGIDSNTLEALYALGHRLYTAGEYKDSETAFHSLCMYDYSDSRYWMGLAASLQAQNRLEMAAEIYGMAGLASKLSDPAPFYYAAVCQLRLGDLESADATLTALETMARPDDPGAESVLDKARRLQSIVKDSLEKKSEKGD